MPPTPASRSSRRGRPPRLSQDAIVAAAARVPAHDLSMHALARELGVAHSALYRWVGSREALMRLVGDAVLERVTPAPLPAGADWHAWLGELARTMRREFLAVPGYATRLIGPHEHSPAYAALERIVASTIEERARVSADAAQQSWYVLATSVIGWVAIEEGREMPLEPEPRFEALLEVLLAGLPARARP